MNLNPTTWFRTSRGGKEHGGAHMTFAKTSVWRTITRTGVFLRKQIWIWPIIAVVLLTVVGLGVRHAIVTTMKDGLQSELQTRLDIETAMLETWFHIQRSNAESLANAVDVRHVIYEMLNDSARNCSVTRSVIRLFFCSAASTLAIPGPKSTLRPELPKVPTAGRRNAEVSNHLSTVRWNASLLDWEYLLPASPLRARRSHSQRSVSGPTPPLKSAGRMWTAVESARRPVSP